MPALGGTSDSILAVSKRLGYLHVFNPEHAERAYTLDLSLRDERIVAE